MPQRATVSLLLISLVAAFAAALLGCGSIQAAAADSRAAGRASRADALGGRLPDAPGGHSGASAATGIAGSARGRLLRRQDRHAPLLHGRSDYCKCMYVGTEENYQQYEKLKLNEQFQAKEGEVSRENLEAQQMEDMDEQEEMFNPYGMGLVGPMGPAMYW